MRHPTPLYYLDDETGVVGGPARRLRLSLLLPQSLLVSQFVFTRLAGGCGVGPSVTAGQGTGGRYRRPCGNSTTHTAQLQAIR